MIYLHIATALQEFWIATLCMAVLAVGCHQNAFAENPPIVITVVVGGPVTEAAAKMLEEAYSRLDIPVVFRELPGERAFVMTNNGETDAEMYRVDGMQRLYPNLVQIPISYIQTHNVVFSKTVDFRVTGWDSLRPYVIAARMGLKQAEVETRGMKRYMTDGSEAAFQMLASGRVQLVVEGYLTGLDCVKRLNLEGVTAQEPPLTINPLYHYVHQKHNNLARDLTKIFQDMQDKGRFQDIYDEVIQQLMQDASGQQHHEK